MDIWQHIIMDRKQGARELVAVYQNRLYTAAMILCRDPGAALSNVHKLQMSKIVHKNKCKCWNEPIFTFVDICFCGQLEFVDIHSSHIAKYPKSP